ncbi:hypothetical protein WI99_11665 [Burkholderia cepacia]|nr:hypothetical protein WI99_11665 [Burkholderia cepacia]
MESVAGTIEPFVRIHRDFLITVLNVSIQSDDEIKRAGTLSEKVADELHDSMYDAAPLDGEYSERYHSATGQHGILMLAGASQAAVQLRDFVIYLIVQRDDLVSDARDGKFPTVDDMRKMRKEFEAKVEEFFEVLATAYNDVEQ